MSNLADRSGYLSDATIASPITGSGGAVSIIRISGTLSFSVLEKLIGKAPKNQPRKLIRSFLHDMNGRRIDDALYVQFVAPQSYTGEDSVELNLHGSHYLVHQIMETLAHWGVRQALPGEFSFRAVRNGKLSLFQAQGVADLIHSSNSNAVSLALEKVTGEQNQGLFQLSEDLKKCAIMAELGIDFSDQDIDELALSHLKNQIQSVKARLVRLRDSFKRGIRIQDGVSVVFTGLPNAGKSSLFNALLGEDRSIVSSTAGTTRDIVRETLTLRNDSTSITFRMGDTAGLRATEDAIEHLGIQKTLGAVKTADLNLFVVESSIDLNSLGGTQLLKKQWENLCELVPNMKEKTIGILTKTDLISQEEGELLSNILSKQTEIRAFVPTSAKTGVGIATLVQHMIAQCSNLVKREDHEILLTRVEQRAAAEQAILHIDRALSAGEIDLFAADLRQTLAALEPLIGQTLPDDILGSIFSNFCIGK